MFTTAMRRLALASIVLGIAGMHHCAPVLAYTMAPPSPDPWFSASIEIDPKTLPPHVEFKKANLVPAGSFAGNFFNPNPTPLYLVRAPTKPLDWMRDLPPGVVPTGLAVSRGWFTMREPGEWTRAGDGIPISRVIRLPLGETPAADFEMDAYLGKRKITIAGRYAREWIRPSPGSPFQTDRVEMKTALPEPLRLIEATNALIINYGAVPLYTVPPVAGSGNASASAIGWLSEVPAGFLALRKIVGGKSYFAVMPDLITDRRLPQGARDGWVETTTDLAMVAMVSERMLDRLVAGFKFEQVYRDNRPADVVVPAPSPFELTAFYGAQRISITGRIIYTLNGKYDALAGKRDPACVSCTGVMCDECAKINARRLIGQ